MKKVLFLSLALLNGALLLANGDLPNTLQRQAPSPAIIVVLDPSDYEEIKAKTEATAEEIIAAARSRGDFDGALADIKQIQAGSEAERRNRDALKEHLFSIFPTAHLLSQDKIAELILALMVVAGSDINN